MICNSHRRENGGATCDDCPLCAAESERAAIVAWLRDKGMSQHSIVADEHADSIERGDYRMGEP